MKCGWGDYFRDAGLTDSTSCFQIFLNMVDYGFSRVTDL